MGLEPHCALPPSRIQGIWAHAEAWLQRPNQQRRPASVPVPWSGRKQYQSTMDVSHGMPHCFVMKSPKARDGTARLLLSVVDDDESIRESLPDLLREFGFEARTFSSAEEFLSSDCIAETRCLILDIAMPGMSGPGLQHELKCRAREIPIIFVTGQRDETVRARTLKQGAAGFLLKPFSDAALLAAIKTALQGA